MSRRHRTSMEPTSPRVIAVENPSDMPSDAIILDALDGKCTIKLGTAFTIAKGTKEDRIQFEFSAEHGFLPAEASEGALAAYFLTCVRDGVCLIRAVRDEDDCPGCEMPDCPHFGLEIGPPPGSSFRVSLLQAMSAVLFDYTDELFLSPTGVRVTGISLEDSKEITAAVRPMASNPALLEDDAVEDSAHGDEDEEELGAAEFDDGDLDEVLSPKNNEGNTVH